MKIIITLVALLIGSHVHAQKLTVNKERTIELIGAVQAPGILYQSNQLLQLSKESSDPVYLVINSPGGAVYAGLQFINAMEVARSRGVEIHCVVPGMAMSMAFQIYLHCDQRYALPYSLLLWHPVRISGLFLLTPQDASNISKDLDRIESALYPMLQITLGAYGMSEEDVRHHYLVETTWTAMELAALLPGFTTLVLEIEDMGAIWNTDKIINATKIEGPDLGPEKPYEIIYKWKQK